MQLAHSVIKVSNLTRSRQWYSSLLFEDTYQNGDGWCSWKSGVTIISEDKWNEYFMLSLSDENDSGISLVLEVPSFDAFLRILSLRDDRDSIVAGEGRFQGRNYIKLIDPDMNIVVGIESIFEYATLTDSESRIGKGSDDLSSLKLFEKKK